MSDDSKTDAGVTLPAANCSTHEAYPARWKHATIHFDPVTGEMHSGGDHGVRHWMEEKLRELRELHTEAAGLDAKYQKLREEVRESAEKQEAFRHAASRCRYYLKHQDHPKWEDMSEFERGVAVTCENLAQIMIEEAEKLSSNAEAEG